ncbi:hypothetical protein C8F04DRAFT_1227342 [Mycena alexandri]|uniref:Uncharacterized protein n=1 Tax=Mycena alexandri TaxID=1745969 RepID=A0AAD6TGB4_9AGAR|nr:hypothetical protein C8F04DRAFT_1227342 [Mycena alexandri]
MASATHICLLGVWHNSPRISFDDAPATTARPTAPLPDATAPWPAPAPPTVTCSRYRTICLALALSPSLPRMNAHRPTPPRCAKHSNPRTNSRYSRAERGSEKRNASRRGDAQMLRDPNFEVPRLIRMRSVLVFRVDTVARGLPPGTMTSAVEVEVVCTAPGTLEEAVVGAGCAIDEESGRGGLRAGGRARLTEVSQVQLLLVSAAQSCLGLVREQAASSYSYWPIGRT